jgi:hypothetical protein
MTTKARKTFVQPYTGYQSEAIAVNIVKRRYPIPSPYRAPAIRKVRSRYAAKRRIMNDPGW